MAEREAAPYLSAAVTILTTLEREVRASATPGSAFETSANALAIRRTELQSQLGRMEFEARSKGLLSQLDEAAPPSSKRGAQGSKPGTQGRQQQQPPAAAASAQLLALQGKLAQAEKDAKAFKARLRHDRDKFEELSARVPELER